MSTQMESKQNQIRHMRNEQISINAQMEQTKTELEGIKQKVQQFQMSTVAGTFLKTFVIEQLMAIN